MKNRFVLSIRGECRFFAYLFLFFVVIPCFHAQAGVFARFELLEPPGSNYFLRISATIHNDPWSVREVVWPTGADSDAGKRVAAGQFTEWFDVGQYLGARLHGRLNRAGGIAEFPNINAMFVTGISAATGITHRVVIELATAPGDTAVVRRFEETFLGDRTGFLVSPTLAKDAAELETVWQMAERHLRWAREATGGTRIAPTNLILQTQFWGPPLAADAEAVWLLGFNVVDFPAEFFTRSPEARPPAGHYWVEFGPDLTRDEIDKQIRAPAQATKPMPYPSPFSFSDEIACRPAIGTNAAGIANFRAWLAEQNVTPQDLGVSALSDVVPIETPEVLRERQKQASKAANRVFYYTSRFRQASATERLRWLTESFHRYAATNALASTLVADHPYFGGTGLGMGMDQQNTTWGGWPLALDWFDLARRKAVDLIGIEDWMGLQYMYGPEFTWEGPQLMGFQTTIMRSGSEGTLPIIAWITPSNDTNFILKISSALAQGAKHCFFWTYGPTCQGTENYWSDLRGAYVGFARYARQLAAAESVIAPGVTRSTRVALLYSISSDLWQPFGYIHMLERRATYLALVHNQYKVDMLTEEDVTAGRLKNYDVLYVTDACVARAAASTIEQWVESGGYLFGSCGAGSRNEFNEPAPGLAKTFGIAQDVNGQVQPGEYRVRGNLNGMSYTDQIAIEKIEELGDPVEFGALGVKIAFKPTTGRVVGHFSKDAPAAVMNAFGKGKALYIAACPGLSYLKDAKFVPAELKEQYPPTQRRLINGMAMARGVPRLVELSQPVVEAGLYDSARGSALVLANFTYQPIAELTVRVPLNRKVRTVRSVEHGELSFDQEKASPALKGQGYKFVAVFTMPLGLNDIVMLE